jgi:hypothetical protein
MARCAHRPCSHLQQEAWPALPESRQVDPLPGGTEVVCSIQSPP